MKQYLLLLKSSDFNKSDNIWTTDAINLYSNDQYKNYSSTRSALGLNTIGDKTYVGTELTSPSTLDGYTALNADTIYMTNIGEVIYEQATPSIQRFIDTSSRIDILSYRHIFTNIPGTISPTFNLQMYESDTEDGPWLKSALSGETNVIFIRNAKPYVKVELEIYADEIDINLLGLVFYLEIGIYDPIPPVISNSVRNILKRFPSWTALFEDSMADATPSLAIPQSTGGAFLNALLGENLDYISAQIDLYGINAYINSADINELAWCHVSYNVPPNINTITGDDIPLGRVSSLLDFFNSRSTDYVFYYNMLDRQLITMRNFSVLNINGIIYNQDPLNIYNDFDEFGARVSLPRLNLESNSNYKKRILDVTKNIPGVSADAYKKTIRRELDLWRAYGATPDSDYSGATPEILEISDIESSTDYFSQDGKPLPSFKQLVEDLNTKYPSNLGYVNWGDGVWDYAGALGEGVGRIPAIYDTDTDLPAAYYQPGVGDFDDAKLIIDPVESATVSFSGHIEIGGTKISSTPSYVYSPVDIHYSWYLNYTRTVSDYEAGRANDTGVALAYEIILPPHDNYAATSTFYTNLSYLDRDDMYVGNRFLSTHSASPEFSLIKIFDQDGLTLTDLEFRNKLTNDVYYNTDATPASNSISVYDAASVKTTYSVRWNQGTQSYDTVPVAGYRASFNTSPIAYKSNPSPSTSTTLTSPNIDYVNANLRIGSTVYATKQEVKNSDVLTSNIVLNSINDISASGKENKIISFKDDLLDSIIYPPGSSLNYLYINAATPGIKNLYDSGSYSSHGGYAIDPYTENSYLVPSSPNIKYQFHRSDNTLIGSKNYLTSATVNFSYPNYTYNITSTSYSTTYTTQTYTTSRPHGFAVGDIITITGSIPSSYNTTRTITGINGTTQFYFIGNQNPRSALAQGTTTFTIPSTTVAATALVAGRGYTIVSLGSTTQAQWNTAAGTTGVTYAIGSVFTAATVGAGSGTVSFTGTSKPSAFTATGVTQSSTNGSGSGAVFTIVKTGTLPVYNSANTTVTITSGGSNYQVGNTITIPGTSLGSGTATNNLTLLIATKADGLYVSGGTVSNPRATPDYIIVDAATPTTYYPFDKISNDIFTATTTPNVFTGYIDENNNTYNKINESKNYFYNQDKFLQTIDLNRTSFNLDLEDIYNINYVKFTTTPNSIETYVDNPEILLESLNSSISSSEKTYVNVNAKRTNLNESSYLTGLNTGWLYLDQDQHYIYANPVTQNHNGKFFNIELTSIPRFGAPVIINVASDSATPAVQYRNLIFTDSATPGKASFYNTENVLGNSGNSLYLAYENLSNISVKDLYTGKTLYNNLSTATNVISPFSEATPSVEGREYEVVYYVNNAFYVDKDVYSSTKDSYVANLYLSSTPPQTTSNINSAVYSSTNNRTSYITSKSHGFSVGDTVGIAGTTPNSYSTTGTVTGVTSPTAFYLGSFNGNPKSALAQGTTTFTASGTSITTAATYTGVTQSATNGSGSGAVFTIVKTGSGTAYNGFITVSPVRTNLCLNPSFGANTTGWNSAAATNVRTAGTITGGSGSWSLVSTASSAATYGAYYGLTTSKVGDTLTASISCLRKSGSRSYRIQMQFYTGALTLISTVSGTASTCATSTRLSVTGTIPANTVFINFTVYSTGTGSSGDSHQIDALLIERSLTVKDYFDGNTANASWTGTADNSSSTIVAGGSNYQVGNTITIPGTSLGGTTPTNNLTLTIATKADGLYLSGGTVVTPNSPATYEIVYESDYMNNHNSIDLDINQVSNPLEEGYVYIDTNEYEFGSIDAYLSPAHITDSEEDLMYLSIVSYDINGNLKPNMSFNIYGTQIEAEDAQVQTNDNGFATTIIRYAGAIPATLDESSILISGIIDTPTAGYQKSIPFKIYTNNKFYLQVKATPVRYSIQADGLTNVSIVGRIYWKNKPFEHAIDLNWIKERTLLDLFDGTPADSITTNSDGTFVINNDIVSQSNTNPGHWFLKIEIDDPIIVRNLLINDGEDLSLDAVTISGDIVYWNEAYDNVQYANEGLPLPSSFIHSKQQNSDLTATPNFVYKYSDSSSIITNDATPNWIPEQWVPLRKFDQYQLKLFGSTPEYITTLENSHPDYEEQ